MTMKSYSVFAYLFVLFHMSTLCCRQINSIPDKTDVESIFIFGDSLTDAGNLLISSPEQSQTIGKLPYGQTYFKHPTGRCSDGRLIIDFIAEAFKLPLLQPYLAGTRGHVDFRQGANFAVAGATSLHAKVLKEQFNVSELSTELSLSVQLGWFKELKPSLCNTSNDCAEFFRKSLFFVGEIGINDYSFALFSGGDIPLLQKLVPPVIDSIAKTAGSLIEEGAVLLMLPGAIPLGCTPMYLTRFASKDERDYDPQNGCLIAYNNIAIYHNQLLNISVKLLRMKYPQAKIFYADYYNPTISIFNSPDQFRFKNRNVVQRACCGGGGPYNYNVSALCGVPGSTVCEDPSAYASWDGSHFTEAAYRVITLGFLSTSLTNLSNLF